VHPPVWFPQVRIMTPSRAGGCERDLRSERSAADLATSAIELLRIFEPRGDPSPLAFAHVPPVSFGVLLNTTDGVFEKRA
jgi:hypothetical protein